MKRLLLLVVGAIFLAGFMLSCKQTKLVVAPKRIKHLSVGRVTRLVKDNSLKFETLTVKKVSISLDNNGKTHSLRGAFKIRRDSIIQVSAQKLAIPVGKLEMDTDSFRVVDFMDQENIYGSIDYISGLLGLDIDFNVVQSILTDQIFSVRQDSKDRNFRDFACEIENGLYRITSIRDRKLSRITKNEDRLERYRNRKEDGHLVKQDIFVDPDMFVVRKMTLDDMDFNRKVSFEFSKFEKVDNQWFPSLINMSFKGDKNIELSIDLSKISLNDERSFGFSTAPKYKKKFLHQEL